MPIKFERYVFNRGNKIIGGDLHFNINKVNSFMNSHPSFKVIEGSLTLYYKTRVNGCRRHLVTKYFDLELEDFYTTHKSIDSTLNFINLVCKELKIGIDDIYEIKFIFLVMDRPLPEYYYSYPSSFSKLQIFKIVVKDLLGRYIKQLKIKVAGLKG